MPDRGQQRSRAVSSEIGSWSRNVPLRVDDGGALVTDDRLGDTRLLEIRSHRAEHPAGRDNDGDSARWERVIAARVRGRSRLSRLTSV